MQRPFLQNTSIQTAFSINKAPITTCQILFLWIFQFNIRFNNKIVCHWQKQEILSFSSITRFPLYKKNLNMSNNIMTICISLVPFLMRYLTFLFLLFVNVFIYIYLAFWLDGALSRDFLQFVINYSPFNNKRLHCVQCYNEWRWHFATSCCKKGVPSFGLCLGSLFRHPISRYNENTS